MYHGNSLSVLPNLDSESFDAVITDPPYGIAYQSAWRTDKAKRKPRIANDDAPFVWWLYDAYRITRNGGCLLCFSAWKTAEAFRLAIEWSGFRVGAQLVWDRVMHGMGDLKGRPSPRHDVVWMAVKGKYRLPGKRPSSVYRHTTINGEQLCHPNEKPLSLLKEMVRDYVPIGGSVIDPFCGSGTTVIASVSESCTCVGIESDAKYCEIAKNRLEKQTEESFLRPLEFDWTRAVCRARKLAKESGEGID